jgi:hypothetical protein
MARMEHSQQDSPRYSYSSLDCNRQEIRLLQVLPATYIEEPISCILEIVTLQDLPRYTAISYCWGSIANKTSIFVDNKRFSVTENLALALLYIRNHLASSSLISQIPQLFWIDAICL